MSAVIIDLATYREAASSRPAVVHEPKLVEDQATNNGERFQFWTGHSGRRYVHTVYSLLECPSLPACNYILVHRDEDGHRQILEVGRASSESSSLNLADIRMKGARLGANEVHVHLLARSSRQAKALQNDLHAGLLSQGLELRRNGSVY